jgi:hypothetical protein
MKFEISGYCPVCESAQTFRAERDGPLDEKWFPNWFRGDLKCLGCLSIPRERAIAHVIEQVAPQWRQMSIHECSPSGVFSGKLQRQCANYITTQYDPSTPFGSLSPKGWRNEDLQNQTFADEIFDLVITQDVFEHLLLPGRAAREIARTLKFGGMAVMSVPLVRQWGGTRRRAALVDGKVIHLLPEEYHGNPVGDGRALVTVDWGPEIAAYLSYHSGITFTAWFIDDLRIGVRDANNVIVLARKGPVADLGE